MMKLLPADADRDFTLKENILGNCRRKTAFRSAV
jgi:hypothetical protein